MLTFIMLWLFIQFSESVKVHLLGPFAVVEVG